MRRENKLSFLAFVLLAGMLSSATVSFAVAEERPNILYIMSDDHAVTAIVLFFGGGWSDQLRKNGSPFRRKGRRCE